MSHLMPWLGPRDARLPARMPRVCANGAALTQRSARRSLSGAWLLANSRLREAAPTGRTCVSPNGFSKSAGIVSHLRRHLNGRAKPPPHLSDRVSPTSRDRWTLGYLASELDALAAGVESNLN